MRDIVIGCDVFDLLYNALFHIDMHHLCCSMSFCNMLLCLFACHFVVSCIILCYVLVGMIWYIMVCCIILY